MIMIYGRFGLLEWEEEEISPCARLLQWWQRSVHFCASKDPSFMFCSATNVPFEIAIYLNVPGLSTTCPWKLHLFPFRTFAIISRCRWQRRSHSVCRSVFQNREWNNNSCWVSFLSFFKYEGVNKIWISFGLNINVERLSTFSWFLKIGTYLPQ